MSLEDSVALKLELAECKELGAAYHLLDRFNYQRKGMKRTSYKPERRDPDRERVLRLNSSELNCRRNRCRIPRPIRIIKPIKDHKCVSRPVGGRSAASCVCLNAQSPTEIPSECHFDTFAMRTSWIARYYSSLRVSKKVV